MKVVCAWCGCHICDLEPGEGTSHGICLTCFAKEVPFRGVGDEEWAWMCANKPHAAAAAGFIRIWWTEDGRTLVCDDSHAWAFDCRLSPEMVEAQHKEQVQGEGHI